MGDQILRWIADLYGSAFDQMLIGDTINKVMGGGGASSASAATSAVMDICINTVCPAMASIGCAISLLFFIIAMIDLSTTERLTFEFFIKFFSKLVVSVFLIGNCDTLLSGCISFGNSLTSMISTGLGSGDTTGMTGTEIANQLYTTFMTTEGIKWFVTLIQSLISIGIIYIVSVILIVIVYIVGFTRMLEMAVRAAFMPIALGLMSDDGWRGAGGRYIRKFLAICSQGAVLAMVGYMANVVMKFCASSMSNWNDTGTATGNLVIMLGIAFASASLMFKSIGIVNDVFGA